MAPRRAGDLLEGLGLERMTTGQGLWRLGLGVTLLGATVACSGLDPEDDTCLSVDDGLNCEPLRPPLEDAWDCVGGPTEASPYEPTETLTYSVEVVDWNSGETPQDLLVLACDLLDGGCMAPRSATPMQALPRDGNKIQIPLPGPAPFNGFLKFVPASDPSTWTANSYIPLSYYFGGPVFDGVDAKIIRLLRGVSVAQLAQARQGAEGGQLDIMRNGLIVVRTLDCNGERAQGVRVQLADGISGVPFSIVGGLPIISDPPQLTDPGALAGFANVSAPQNVVIEGFVDHDGDGTFTNYGRGGFTMIPYQITFGDIRPYPLASYGE
jgi:hypothetical protein